jgi:hypothetical protein
MHFKPKANCRKRQISPHGYSYTSYLRWKKLHIHQWPSLLGKKLRQAKNAVQSDGPYCYHAFATPST